MEKVDRLDSFNRNLLYDDSLGLYVGKGEEDEEDDNLASWHDNWVFKEAKLAHTHSRINAVAMLLPNATDDIKAQIGNKDFDLVSELTENVTEVLEDVTSDNDIDIVHPENDNEYTVYEMKAPVTVYSAGDNSGYLWLGEEIGESSTDDVEW